MKSYIKSIINILVYLLTIVLYLGSCNETSRYNNIRFNTTMNLENFFKSKISIREILNEEFDLNYDGISIKNNILCISAFRKNKSPKDKDHFFLYNLSTRKKIAEIENPTEDFLGSSFDFIKDSIITLSVSNQNILYYTDIHSLKSKKVSLSSEYSNCLPSKIIVNKNQAYLIDDIFGFSIVDLKSKTKRTYSQELLGIQNSAISFPIDTYLNLLSGRNISVESREIILYAVDSLNNVLWQTTVERSGEKTVFATESTLKLNNYKDYFILIFDNIIRILEKKNGLKVFEHKFENIIENSILVDDNLAFIYRTKKQNLNDFSNQINWETNLILFNLDSHKIIWNKNFEGYLDLDNVFIHDGTIFFTANDSLQGVTLNEGSKINNAFYLSNINLKVIQDMSTNRVYILYNNFIYW